MGNLLAHHCQETMLIKWFFRLELAQLGSSGFQGSSPALAESSWMQIQPEHSPGHSDHTVTPSTLTGPGAAGRQKEPDYTNGLGHTPTSQEDLKIQM